MPTPTAFQVADAIFDEGMEHWWVGDRRAAARSFRRALKRDPLHADALNHLGIIDLDARRLKSAERNFRAAVEGGVRGLRYEDGKLPWAILDNRPYLRALANLALVCIEREEWAEALAVHERMLKLAPDDNLGVRFLIGIEYLHVGDAESAIRSFADAAHEEVGCAFGLALARLRASGLSADIGAALLTGFAANRYVAPMLLREDWEPLDGWHGSNMAEPEWARSVYNAQADFWFATSRARELLRFWWMAPAVASWRRQLDQIMVRLKESPASAERSELIAEGIDLRSEATIGELVRSVRTAS